MKMYLKFVLLISFLSCSCPVLAQEVYNFYFNKNGEPENAKDVKKDVVEEKKITEVKDSEDKEKILENSSEQPMAKKGPITEKKEPAVRAYQGWEFGLGVAYINQREGSGRIDKSRVCFSRIGRECEEHYDYDVGFKGNGINLLGTYNFNHVFGVDFGLAYLKTDTSYVKTESGFNLQAGLAITPIRVHFLGHDLLDLSLQGGLVSYRHYSVRENDYDMAPHITGSAYVIDPYFGARLTLNLGKKVALYGEAKKTEHDNLAVIHSSFGVKYRL